MRRLATNGKNEPHGTWVMRCDYEIPVCNVRLFAGPVSVRWRGIGHCFFILFIHGR